jgi:putative ABC transport system permease protein
MEVIFKDMRYALRMLIKSPGFAAVAVLTLAIGIGANTAIFSVVNSVLLRPLPFRDPDRLVMLYENNQTKGHTRVPVAAPNYIDWRNQNQIFEQMAANWVTSFNLASGGDPERLRGARVSAGFFEMLGVQPIRGRVFSAEEDQPGRDNVVLASYGLWQRRFGADPGIIGKTVKLNGQDYTLIGVMPHGFQFPEQAELWTPAAFNNDSLSNRGGHFIYVLGRLKQGATLGQAQGEMATIARRLEQQYPDFNEGWGVDIVPLHEMLVGDMKQTLLVLLAAVGFVLLIACSNVANLLLARATSRHKEIAIRSALGATRLHLIRQLLTESLMLALLGGGLGLLLALWGVDLLVSINPDNIPRIQEIGVDRWVLGFTLLLSVFTGLAFGLVPAIQSSRLDLTESLKDSGRNLTASARHRVRSLLVITEVALALVLLIGAGLMIKSFYGLLQVRPGFNPEKLLTMEISLRGTNYSESDKRAEFFRNVLERVKNQPGVESAGVTASLPLSRNEHMYGLIMEGQSNTASATLPTSSYAAVSADYFSTMGIPLVKGRYFTEQDNKSGRRVAIINEALARRYFPNEDPIGKRLEITNGPPAQREIVGVVGDVKQSGLDKDVTAQIYEPYLQQPYSTMSLVVRGSGSPASLTGAVRSQVQVVDRDQPISNIKTMEQLVADSVAQPRLSMFLLGIFAAVALLLSAVGIYGVMSYSVFQRTHEIGIRMALGAQARDVLRMIVGQGMSLALIGVGLGLTAAFVLMRIMSSLLYQVSATDPSTFVAISFLLTGVAFLACYIPARRATRVDPMIALRNE